MTTIPAARRLSPKVRRLLAEHDLQARAVAGTGRGGRVTPHDVLGTAGVSRQTARGAGRGAARGSVLASPLARRLLRDAGLDLPAAARANDHRRITRADAERLIDELSVESDAGSPLATPARATAVAAVEADVGRLLAALAAGDEAFRSHNGFELTLEVAVASAVAAVLVRRPELAGGPTTDAGAPGSASPGINIGFVTTGPDEPALAVVPDAQYLTVSGLARRVRAAAGAAAERSGSGEHSPTGATEPTVVVASGDVALGGMAPASGLGLLTVETATPRRVAGTDELGHELVRTRPHATLRLHHHGDGTSHEAAVALLEELGAAMTAWSLPVGP